MSCGWIQPHPMIILTPFYAGLLAGCDDRSTRERYSSRQGSHGRLWTDLQLRWSLCHPTEFPRLDESRSLIVAPPYLSARGSTLHGGKRHFTRHAEPMCHTEGGKARVVRGGTRLFVNWDKWWGLLTRMDVRWIFDACVTMVILTLVASFIFPV